MILPDVNLLLYAVNEDSPFHSKAKTWLESTLSGPETVGFSWQVLLAFLRLTTRPGIFQTPLKTAQAFAMIRSWLDQPPATILHPGPKHLRIMEDILTPLGKGGNLTSDAHLAALAIELGAELHSLDNDFSRFASLHWRNPLLAVSNHRKT